MSEENKYILQVKDLHTSFATDAGEVRAVNGVSFNLEPGKTLGIVESPVPVNPLLLIRSCRFLRKPEKLPEERYFIAARIFPSGTKKQMQKFRGEKCSIIFQGSDDKPESGIYDWKSVDGGNSAPHRQG